MSFDLSDVITAYGSAWREPDDARRLDLLELSWTDDGVYQDPSNEARGRKALCDLIGGFLKSQPGAVVELTSGVARHHNRIYFSWHLLTESGEVAINGVDFGTLDADGRLKEIVGYFGPPPSLS